ncbi:hypothetical protein ACFZCY_43280 [Streptomyces sp. NPDC007983]
MHMSWSPQLSRRRALLFATGHVQGPASTATVQRDHSAMRDATGPDWRPA